MQFSRASKKSIRLRLALVGVSGAGKTYTSLNIAKYLGRRVAVIDTENGSASRYSDLFEFDVLELVSFSPQQYIDALHLAGKAGYDVVIVDSLSHAWMGIGGTLDQVDKASKRSQSKNTFAAWREVTPQHNALVDAMLRCPFHLIVTMRAKTEYVLEKDDKGRTFPKKVGIQPVQKDGLEFEFDVVADLDMDHNLLVGKTRCQALDGQVYRHAGQDVADVLRGWLGNGAHPGALETQLQASVESMWPKLTERWMTSMAEASTPGELLEAWMLVAADIKRLKPPTEIMETMTKFKDDRKRELQGQPLDVA